MKQLLFRHYPAIALVFILMGGLVVWRVGADQRLPLVGAIVAGAFSFVYFVQQQKLAETHLFKELFTEFNRRYDQMNEQLAAIRDGAPLSIAERHSVVDYLNLCAEEYLFYREGYIHTDVWRSWCCGMLQYLDREPLLEVWREEGKSGSYYGLSLEAIRRGAGRSAPERAVPGTS